MTSIQELNCIFCKESFDNKEELQVHFRKHGDPTFNQSLKDKKRSQSNAQVQSVKSNKEIEMVSCDVCPEVFPTISKAITHKHKVHPDNDTKYFCPWCGKLFTMKHLYNKHMTLNHEAIDRIEDNSFHCDCCDINFYVPSAMLYHNKFFHRQDTELPAIGQSKKLNLFNQEVLQIYYCAFCGEEYNNKVNLHKHMGDDHSDENQSPEDVLRCPLCEAIFYHLDAYELHLTYHSPDDVYSEKSEMIVNDIMEYSLEAVPPIMERVENYKSPQDANKCENAQYKPQDTESTMNVMGIESFLELEMDDSANNTNNEHTSEKIKSKKHKKHKKSKKSAITLDEFLNMNKDVFGEGLDFQGIEEVPTKVMTKQLKGKKHSQMLNTDLDKLKKQGIVVKMKSTTNPSVLRGVKIGSIETIKKPVTGANKTVNKIKSMAQTNPNILSTSDEVLSKLINQSNNQIQIKKSGQENKNAELKISQTASRGLLPSDIQDVDDKTSTLENYEAECDTIQENKETLSEINEAKAVKETTERGSEKEFSNNETKIIKENLNKSFTDLCDDGSIKCKSPGAFEYDDSVSKSLREDTVSENNITENKDQESFNINANSKILSNHNNDNNTENNVKPQKVEKSNTTISDSLNSLKSISNQITVKPIQNATNVRTPVETRSKNITTDLDSTIDDYNEDTHKKNNAIVKKIKEQNEGGMTKSLNALKHLSNIITVKPVNKVSPSSFNNENTRESNNEFHEENDDNLDVEKDIVGKSEGVHEVDTSIKQKKYQDRKETSITSLEALKNLSKHITIKSMGQTSRTFDNEFEDESYDMDTDLNTKINIENKNVLEKKSKQSKTKMSDQNTINILKNISPEINIQSASNSLQTKCNEQNITVKSLSVENEMNRQVSFKSTTQCTRVMKSNFIQSSTKNNEINEEMEIFNIDDSDSDDAGDQSSSRNQISNKPKIISTPIKKKEQLNLNTAQPLKVNINKHVAIKTINRPTKQFKEDSQDASYGVQSDDSADYVDDNHTNLSSLQNTNCNNQRSLNPKNITHALKNLGKHITIRSTNCSPNLSIRSQDQSTQDSTDNIDKNNVDSDSDSYSSKIKITEIREDDISEEEDPSEEVHKPKCCPNVSENENDSYEELDDQMSDVESCIKASTLKKSNHSSTLNRNSMCLDSLKNISKDITVKALNDKKHEKGNNTNFVIQNQTSKMQNNIDKFPTIQSKQIKTVGHRESETSTNKNLEKNSVPLINKSTMNQKVSTSSNQVNTINKEVTVKTFQSKTVIEEVTTTVTKTIKTVNQMVKQEVLNTSHTTAPTFRTQKVVQGFKSNQQSNSLQGMTVRHASPSMLYKARNPGIRPAVGTTVRPSNQLVPVRSPRPSNPRMPIVKTLTPSVSSQQKPLIGKPLKISPNVLTSSVKRQASEGTGPFSCFKKPKESLFPVSDLPLNSDQEGESTVQFASSSHMSQSNFASTTKTVKGSSVVTSTQMKSEVSACSQQQLKRLGNVSGLKIVKASQAKQATQVEEKSEMSSSKRTALEAIEKLQKQGLLVKKPRVNINNDSENSNSCDEDAENTLMEDSDD